MKITKYKITADKCSGHMIVTYNDGEFKSILNEFNPPLNERQLNGILNYIPKDPKNIIAMFVAQYGQKVKVEAVKAIGAEPEQDASPEFPVNEKIALWCNFYAANHKDDLQQPVKYKTGPAEAGKLKQLPVSAEELQHLFEVYFKADEWYLKPKSISNFVKKYNEIRALAYAAAPAKKRTFPLPFDAVYFGNLNTTDKHAYWQYLRDNGYKWVEKIAGRPGKWEKDHTIKP